MRFVVSECTIVKMVIAPPAAKKPYAVGPPNPKSAALANPTISKAVPVIRRSLS